MDKKANNLLQKKLPTLFCKKIKKTPQNVQKRRKLPMRKKTFKTLPISVLAQKSQCKSNGFSRFELENLFILSSNCLFFSYVTLNAIPYFFSDHIRSSSNFTGSEKSRIQSKVTPNYSKYSMEIKCITFKKYNGSRNSMDEKTIMEKKLYDEIKFQFRLKIPTALQNQSGKIIF